MASVNGNPLAQGQLTDDAKLNERWGLSPGAQTPAFINVTGVPTAALGNVGDYAFRTDTPGTANQRQYIKTAAGTWTALVF